MTRWMLLITLLLPICLLDGCGTSQRTDTPKPRLSTLSAGDNPNEVGEVRIRKNCRALLIGVTKYDYLPIQNHLRGPINDVYLIRDVLTRYYGFPSDQIVTLTEDGGEPKRPTRANIEKAFRQLAETAQENDQIVILLSGHGDRQPESIPPHPQFPEPDGIDEIFLAADVRPAVGTPKRVPNAIIDDEIRDWLEAITRKRACVWAIFDCCHSGNMTRGTQILRQLREFTLVPKLDLQKSTELAVQRGSTDLDKQEKPQLLHSLNASDYLVAMYACRPHETTFEDLFPNSNKPEAKYQGLMSYTLAQELTRAVHAKVRMTYRELLQRIELRYAAHYGGTPTPTVEGSGQHRLILGADKPQRPLFSLTQKGTDLYVVNAGDLHGLTMGTILAVFAEDNKEEVNPEPVSYVRVTDVRPLDSTVEFCAYKNKKPITSLPPLARCAIEVIEFALPRFKLGVDPEETSGAVRNAIIKALEPLRKQQGCVTDVVDKANVANWFIRSNGNSVELIESSANRSPYLLPQLDDPLFSKKVLEALEVVFRAKNLIAVGSHIEEQMRNGNSELGIELESYLLRNGQKEDRISYAQGCPIFKPGDRVKFSVRNTSRFSRVDVSLLIVDPDFKIGAFYPSVSEVGKAIGPGEKFEITSDPLDKKPPFGQEYLVAIAVPARLPAVNFSLLTQPGLKHRGYEQDSPLAQLLERAMYATGTRSGFTRTELQEQCMRVLAWRTEP